MSSAAGSLKELHRLHLQLQSVQDRLTQGPKKVEARKRRTEQKRAELDEEKEKLTQARKAADEKSLQLKTNEQKIGELRSKLNAATSNREYDVIRSQIEADEMANSVLEDEILEAYERVDRIQAEIAESEAALQEAHDAEQKVADEVAAAEPGLRQEADRLEGALAEAERALPGNIMDRYRRLVQAHGADALAPVESDSCTSCYTMLSPNERVELNVGKILFCRSCGRLLYKQDD